MARMVDYSRISQNISIKYFLNTITPMIDPWPAYTQQEGHTHSKRGVGGHDRDWTSIWGARSAVIELILWNVTMRQAISYIDDDLLPTDLCRLPSDWIENGKLSLQENAFQNVSAIYRSVC